MKDITGQRFGLLVAKEFDHMATNKHVMWKCICDCGKEVIKSRRVLEKALKTGYTSSCGCNGRLGPGIGHRNSYLNSYKHGAKTRGLGWTISNEDAFALFESDCAYCGNPPSEHPFLSSKRCVGVYRCNGIDRVDNSLGYTFNNVVSCCKTCNLAKHNLSMKEWIQWVERIKVNFDSTKFTPIR